MLIPNPSLTFGPFMARAGDVNGDGLGDLLVGGSANDIYVFLGAPGGISMTPLPATLKGGI